MTTKRQLCCTERQELTHQALLCWCVRVVWACFIDRWLPLHWVLSRAEPSLEAVYLLVEAYPEGLFDPDYEGNLAYDK